MARIRAIQPDFARSPSMGRVSREARLLFVLLWTAVDDEGRCHAAPDDLAQVLYPSDFDASMYRASGSTSWKTRIASSATRLTGSTICAS